MLAYNTSVYLNYGVSLKYEVEHATTIYGENKLIESREDEIGLMLDYCKLVYMFIIATLGSNIYMLIRNKKR